MAPERTPLTFVTRYLPPLLLAVLYGSIAIRKLIQVIAELPDGFGDDVAQQSLLAVHSASGAIFFGSIAVLMLTRKQPIRREKRLVGWTLPFIVTFSMSIIGWYEPRNPQLVMLLIATIVTVVGTGFMIYSLQHLGRHFGVVSDVRGLVTTGPYRWVRHPLYAGEAMTTCGLVLAAIDPITLAAFGVGLSLQIWRARVEEQALTSVFPRYKDYAARTPMLIPLTKPLWRSAGSVPVAD